MEKRKPYPHGMEESLSTLLPHPTTGRASGDYSIEITGFLETSIIRDVNNRADVYLVLPISFCELYFRKYSQGRAAIFIDLSYNTTNASPLTGRDGETNKAYRQQTAIKG
jgi:hypothetical protein